MAGGRLGLGGLSYEYEPALMHRDTEGGERREVGKGRVSCIWGKKFDAGGVRLGMLTSEVETAKTVPRQV